MPNTFIRVICSNKRKIPIAVMSQRGHDKTSYRVAVTATVTTERIFIL